MADTFLKMLRSCFQNVGNIDMFRTELTFKTAMKEALYSGEVRF